MLPTLTQNDTVIFVCTDSTGKATATYCMYYTVSLSIEV